MKKTLALAIVMAGCTSVKPKFEPLPPEPLIKNVAVKAPETSPEELKKGPEPPGRVIDYKGHGLGYGSHAQQQYHIRNTR